MVSFGRDDWGICISRVADALWEYISSEPELWDVAAKLEELPDANRYVVMYSLANKYLAERSCF